MLKSIDSSKHLLLIFPLLFFSEDGSVLLRKSLSACLYADFKDVLAFRMKRHPDKDTYLAYFYHGTFFIDKVGKSALSYFDAVRLRESPLFVKIVQCRNGLNNYQHMNDLLGIA